MGIHLEASDKKSNESLIRLACFVSFGRTSKLHEKHLKVSENHEADFSEKNMVLQTKLLVRCARLQDAKNLSEELNAADLRCARALSTNNRSIWTSSAKFHRGRSDRRNALVNWTLEISKISQVCRRASCNIMQYQDPHFTSFSWPLSTVMHSKRMIPATRSQLAFELYYTYKTTLTFHSHFMIYSSLISEHEHVTDSSHQVWSPNLQVQKKFELKHGPCSLSFDCTPYRDGCLASQLAHEIHEPQGQDDMTKQDTTRHRHCCVWLK